MAEMGSWGSKIFEINSNRVLPFRDFQTSAEIKQDDSTSKKPGLELEKVSFTVPCLAEAAVDPEAEYITWRALIGASHFMYINGRRWQSNPLRLKKVGFSATKMDDLGRIHYAELALEFEEENIAPQEVSSRATASDAERAARA